jgi:lycopene cyclase domain-containing protein
MQVAYLLALLVSVAGVTLLDRRIGARITASRPARRRLAIVLAWVLFVFLLFDLVGAGRGWFASDPDLVVALIPPGIPVEEPILLGFLAFLTVALYAALRHRRRSG